jgi:hypothetical protein
MHGPRAVSPSPWVARSLTSPVLDLADGAELIALTCQGSPQEEDFTNLPSQGNAYRPIISGFRLTFVLIPATRIVG